MTVVAAMMSAITTATTPPTMATVLSESEVAGPAAVCGGEVAVDILSPGPTGTAEVAVVILSPGPTETAEVAVDRSIQACTIHYLHCIVPVTVSNFGSSA